MLPPEGARRFSRSTEVDEDVHSRARVLALGLCAMLAIYAHSVANANLLRESVGGLERTLVD